MPRKQSFHVALDLGTHKTAVLLASMTDDEPHVVGLGTAPSAGLRRGVVINIDATVQAIQRAVHEAEVMADCEIQSVVVGVSGSHVKGFNSHGMVPIRGHEVTAGDIEQVHEAARAVPLPADRHILHVLPKEYVVDEQEGVREAEGMAGVRLEARVHVLTGSTPVVENVIKCCNRSGVTVSQVVLAPLASAEAVLSEEERELGVGMLDIGGGTTDLIVYQAGSVQHTAVLPLGGNHITNDIAAGLQTPAAEAEKLKQRFGSAVSKDVRSDERIEVPSVGGRGPRVLSRQILAEIIEPRVEEMLGLVAAEISRAGVEGMLTSGIVLTGGTANLDGLPALAERVFNVPIRVGSAGHSGGLGDIVSGPAYATGMGLLQLAGKASSDSVIGPASAGVLSKMKNRMGDWFREFF